MSDTQPPPEQIYKIHRDYIEHEDELIHQRTTSLVTIQSFLLATFGFTFQKKIEIVEKMDARDLPISALGDIVLQYNGFLFILALIGAATSFIAWRAIGAAANAITALEANWLRAVQNSPPAHLPRITGGGDTGATKDGIRLATLVPTFLLALWLLTLALVILVIKVDASIKISI